MFTINQNKKMRLDAAIKVRFPNISTGALYKYMRENKIKVNKKKIKLNDTVNAGDIIELYFPSFNDENVKGPAFLRANGTLNVLYEDDNVIITSKIAGMSAISANKNEANTHINLVLKYLHENSKHVQDNKYIAQLCHRLDTGTSGIVIVAKNEQAHNSICEAIKQRQIQKKYLCITYGVPNKKSDTLNAYLIKNSNKGLVFISDDNKKGAKKIVTKYKTLKNYDNLSLMEVELVTGRTHQIRAHLSHIGLPILGDSKYGINKINRKYKFKYQALCAQSIMFNNIVGQCSYLSNKSFYDKNPWYVEKFLSGDL